MPSHVWPISRNLDDSEQTGSKIVEQELIEVLCDDSTGCKEADANGDFHS